MRKIITFTTLLLTIYSVLAQSVDRPGWTYNTPQAGNSTYLYVVERAGGTTVDEARNNALAQVYRSTMMRIGAVVSWDEINRTLQSGEDWGTVSMKYNIPVNKVCEYVEKRDNGFVVSVLCQVAKSGNEYPEWDEFSGCMDMNKYSNGAALLKSVFIPGLGQMGKRRVGSGLFTLMGELVFVGGGIGSYYMANKQLSIMRNYQTTFTSFQNAKANYDLWRTANIACFSAAAALYAWNLYRAFTITPKYKRSDSHLTYYPALIPTEYAMTTGVGITLNF